ncbi:MAG TPA: EAL domain-containing protein [Candidatus Evtepia faecigallinarum]|nr:EAL domain-containing protein [Candidatus Evtepia faecigallinarum]
MDQVWEFFEKMDEMVYAADLETHELVYMNAHLRAAMGFQSHQDYRGKPCYQILQGSQVPCAFCNNDALSALQPGEFLSWTHGNPVLGKRFLIKESVVVSQGRKYRMEMAINMEAGTACGAAYYYSRSEAILNDCMKQVVAETDLEVSIQKILAYMGSTFSCRRTYIFELVGGGWGLKNTYEWCAEDTASRKEETRNVPVSSFRWLKLPFLRNEAVVVQDLEQLRPEHPEAYDILKARGVASLAAVAIKVDGQIIGLLGMDDPDRRMVPTLTSLLNVIGYFVSNLLRRRDMFLRLNELSYHDQLTGALNRHALAEQYRALSADTMGVIYCDITGLKQINDSLGHEAGDQAICRCHELICQAVGNAPVYRAGGDEFIALCANVGQEEFQKTLDRLRALVCQDQCHIAVGHAWSKEHPIQLERLITQADQEMYQDKREYYQKNSHLTGVDRRQAARPRQAACPRQDGGQSAFQHFLKTAYCDVESLFQSVAQNNESSYFYLGDMQKDLFYISDNLRDDFGFSSNLVSGFLQNWAKRITTPEFRELFWQDISAMLREKRSTHRLRYQVRDVREENLWIRSFGIAKWNEDQSAPVFFSGRVTHQDMSFVVDPTSNFPREQAAFRQLAQLRRQGTKTLVIGFGLNGITEINSTKGRSYGDRLLKKVADRLMEKLSWKMSFYRLEGMRSMAIVHPICCAEGPRALVSQIREEIRKVYQDMGISVQNVCSVGLIEYPYEAFTPEDLIEILISLIRVAKQDPKQVYVDYSGQTMQQVRRLSKMTLAISRDVYNNMENFRIVVQPLVSARRGEVIGGEALLRWTFEGEHISPEVFVPILEKENLIHTAGRWVFQQVVLAAKRIEPYAPAFCLSFNASLQQLSDVYFVEFIEHTLKKYQVSGDRLVAELTESSLDEEPEKLDHFIRSCKKLGLQIALDDFGSGYSSLRMMLQYPCGIIKLDRSLVQEMTASAQKMNFIRSIVYACHQFGKIVCMEGVERAEQKEIMMEVGCDLIQGYYYYRPMELPDLFRMLGEPQGEDTALPDGRK